MKKFLLIMIALGYYAASNAQSVNVPEPEFVNSVLFVKDGKTSKLEKAIPFELSRGTVGNIMLGTRGSKVFKQVKGPKSTMRITGEAPYTFILRTYNNDNDPFDEIIIVKMTPTQSNRKYEVASTDMLGQQKDGDLTYVKFDASKYGTKSYLIQIDQKLEQGEYAIQIRNSSDVLNCFGID